jgi:glycosyltransferase involved in cell wall biosynthesis
VVIPAYNAQPYIDAALGSVLAQNIPSVEIIVVDDGSTDGTADRVAAYGERVRYIRQENSGGHPGSPRNAGIAQSTGKYICFLDADDLMAPGRMQEQTGFLREHPEAGAVFTDYRNFSTLGASEQTHFQTCTLLQEKLAGANQFVFAPDEATTHLLQENFGGASTLMITRDVLSTVPSFSTELEIGEDMDFYYRIARRYSIGVINRVGLLRRMHSSNVTGDPIKMLRNHIASRTLLRESERNPVNIRLLDDFLYRRRIDLAYAYADRGNLRQAFALNLRTLTCAFPTSIDRLWFGLRTLGRTAAIALHLKTT